MVGTVEQAVENMARRQQVDELSDADREMIGSFVRIEIPMTDIYRLRQVADLLRGYAGKIDNATRRSDLSLRTILLELKFDAGIVTKAIKELYPDVFDKRWYTHQR